MAQHFLLETTMAGSRQHRSVRQSIDAKFSLDTSRLVTAGVVGILVLAAIFFWATLIGIQTFDSKAIEVERERAIVAIGLAQNSGQRMDSVVAGRIGRDYLFADAHLARPGDLASGEISVPLAGTRLVFAWTPRRLGSETAMTIAPVRFGAAAAAVAGVLFILHRLYSLARELDARRLAARELAARDPLTGLANRRGLNEALEAAFAAGTDLSLLYLDLDDFKQVNDRFGHATGDQLLVCVAQRLIHLLGPNDLVARLGGDEFVILRRGAATEAELADLAQRIHGRITLPYGLGDVEAQVGLSIGIASRSEHMTSPDDLVSSADAALYRAKATEGTSFTMAEELVVGLPKAA